jgi:hypothetical protein
MLRLGPLAVGLVSSLALVSGARADELVLALDAPCTDADRVRAEVESLLGRALRPGDPVVQSQLVVVETADGFAARLSIERDGGVTERELEANTCERLASALALMLALALDPALGAAPPPDPELRIVVAPTPDPERRTPAPGTRVAPDRSPRVRAGIAGGVELGLGAEPTVALRAFAGLRLDRWLFEVDAAFAAATTAFAPSPGATVEVWFAFGVLRAGYLFEAFERLRFGPALELDIGLARGAAGGARALIELRLIGPLGVRARASLGTPIVVPAFEIQPIGALDRPSGLLFGADLGLVLELS